MIPGPRIFRNRWAALLWAGGIVWLAYDVADSAPHAPAPNAPATSATPAGPPPDDADVQAIANLLQ